MAPIEWNPLTCSVFGIFYCFWCLAFLIFLTGSSGKGFPKSCFYKGPDYPFLCSIPTNDPLKLQGPCKTAPARALVATLKVVLTAQGLGIGDQGAEPSRNDCGSFRKLGVPYLGVLILRILLFRYYIRVPYSRKLPSRTLRGNQLLN